MLYLSTGNTTIPNVVGQSRQGAEAQLANLGLGTIQWDTEETDQVAPDTVARTDPEAGDVPQGTSVTVYIAVAPAPEETTVPADLYGKTLEQAQLSCTGAQITCQEASQEPSDMFEAGTVIRSDPAPGSTVEVGATINLVISSGPAEDGNEGEGGGNEGEGEGNGEGIFP
jgi:serine/threonine-protein kinase